MKFMSKYNFNFKTLFLSLNFKLNTKPWKLLEDILQIQFMVQHHNIVVKHYFWEGMVWVADLRSKHATSVTKKQLFFAEDNLSKEIKGTIIIDRMQIPAFRIRGQKYSSWFFELPWFPRKSYMCLVVHTWSSSSPFLLRHDLSLLWFVVK